MPNNISIAEEALKYARREITHGSTQIEGYLDFSLHAHIMNMRNAQLPPGFLAAINSAIAKFEHRISSCKESHLGNCEEYAFMALHYVCENVPDVTAEVYSIGGGDHTFLVIGRNINDPNCNPRLPATWGDDAYICDPWSNEVYPAKEYLNKTKNYSGKLRNEGLIEHTTEKFDETRHWMEPIQEYTSKNVLEATGEANKLVCNTFENLMNKYLSIYDDLVADLQKAKLKLTKKYGNDDSNVRILHDKIEDLKKKISSTREESNTFLQVIRSSENTYHSHTKTYKTLQDKIKTQLQGLRETALLEDDRLTYSNKGSLGTMVTKLINVKPEAFREYQKALQNSEIQLKSCKP